MLHPYSIFFKAMWETPAAAPADDELVTDRAPLRWRMWWRYAARRQAAARASADAAVSVPTSTPAEVPRGGITS